MLLYSHYFMITKKRKIGDIGENISEKFLSKKGYKIVDKNYLKKFGEIDIVTIKDRIYYFFEVKTISVDFDNFEKMLISPEDNFTQSKIQKFDRIVESYVKSNNIKTDYYLGVLFVYLDVKNKKAKVKFIDKIEF